LLSQLELDESISQEDTVGAGLEAIEGLGRLDVRLSEDVQVCVGRQEGMQKGECACVVSGTGEIAKWDALLLRWPGHLNVHQRHPQRGGTCAYA